MQNAPRSLSGIKPAGQAVRMPESGMLLFPKGEAQMFAEGSLL